MVFWMVRGGGLLVLSRRGRGIRDEMRTRRLVMVGQRGIRDYGGCRGRVGIVSGIVSGLMEFLSLTLK